MADWDHARKLAVSASAVGGLLGRRSPRRIAAALNERAPTTRILFAGIANPATCSITPRTGSEPGSRVSRSNETSSRATVDRKLRASSLDERSTAFKNDWPGPTCWLAPIVLERSG